MLYRKNENGSAENKMAREEARKKREAEKARRKAQEDALKECIGKSAHYLVFYDGRIVATFASPDDALLFESELADLARDHGVRRAECKVFERKGHLVGGFTITAGMMVNMLEDEDYRKKYSVGRVR